MCCRAWPFLWQSFQASNKSHAAVNSQDKLLSELTFGKEIKNKVCWFPDGMHRERRSSFWVELLRTRKTKNKIHNNCFCWLTRGAKPHWLSYAWVHCVQVCLVVVVLVFLVGFWCACLPSHHSSVWLLFWWWQETGGHKKSGTKWHHIHRALAFICSLRLRHFGLS